VSVVSTQARRRWSVVLCGIALLCALPAVIAALPAGGLTISAATLRARIIASAGVPYEGYTESTVNLGLPGLPEFQDVSTLFDGTTDQYAWYRSPASWRSAVITGTGENDIYQVGRFTYLWDHGHDVLTRIAGPEPARLPRTAGPGAQQRRLPAAGRRGDDRHLPRRRAIQGSDKITPVDQPGSCWSRRQRPALISMSDTPDVGHAVLAPSLSVSGQRTCCQRRANLGSAALSCTRRRGPVPPGPVPVRRITRIRR